MEWINYHHLLYFWMTAREGTVSKAGRQMRVAQPTISAQIRALERNLGEKLFFRSGRTLALTEIGRVVYRYADEIFTLGRELTDTLKGRATGRPSRLAVGIADAMPKLIAYRLLEPALHLPDPVRLICREGKRPQLLADLTTHALDLVLTDAPAGPEVRVKAFNHLLGECGVTVFATARAARSLSRGFPESLEGAPFLLPAEETTLRRSLDQWFNEKGIRPRVVAEIEDSALVKVFGSTGVGAFAAPSVVETEVRRQFGVRPVGRIEEIREQFYGISIERKLRNPGVVAISEAARQQLFSGG